MPRAAWIVALLVAALHMLPHLHAELDAPAGWQPTGILSTSPDYMQYRVWMRQSQEEGPIVSNRFTTEPNNPYLPVPFYYAIGRTAELTGTSPEWVFAWVGAALAFALSLLLFACSRYFLRSGIAVWTAFLSILIGGGLGGYILYVRQSAWAHTIAPLKMLFITPFEQYVELLDAHRGDYVFSTIFDTHFLLIWVLCLSAVLLFYATIKSFSVFRATATAALFAIATVIHVYEGVTLMMIAAGVGLLCWIKGIKRREIIVTLALCSLAVVAVFAWIALLVRSSELPMPPWRGVSMPPAILLLGFPVAWVLVVWGLARYWKDATLDECFLMGWLLGCTTLALSSPFYPWPNRGVLSMQVPLTIIAASVWFSRHSKLTPRAVVVLLLLMGSTPVVGLQNRWQSSNFNSAQPHKFIGPAHREILTALRGRAGLEDVLLAGTKDRLWLAPEYRGRHYAGHFFLTVDFNRKQSEVEAFYRGTPELQEAFLRDHGIRFLYVNRNQDPARFHGLRGLVAVRETAVGTLFEFVR